MIIQVDFYKKTTGKWYAGGTVDIGDVQLFEDSFIERIFDRQRIMSGSVNLLRDYYMVTDNTEDNDNFAKKLFF